MNLVDARRRLTAAKEKHARRLADERDAVQQSGVTIIGGQPVVDWKNRPEKFKRK